MTEVISSALNFMRLPFDQSLAELFESVAEGGVVDVVTDLDDQAPDQAGIDLEPDDRRGAERTGEPVAQGGLLVVVQRRGRADRDRPAVLATVVELPRRPRDRPERAQAPVAVQDAEESDDDRQGPPFEDVQEDALLLRRRDERR